MTHEDVRREQVRRALLAWSAFPLDSPRRRLVLLGGAIMPGAFPDEDKKIAFTHGAVEAAAGFPRHVLQVIRGHESTHHDGQPLIMTTATKDSTEWNTDRGRKQLPAWRVHAQGVSEPIWVLDPPVVAQTWWPLQSNLPGWLGSTATVEADERTLTLSFSGGPEISTEYARAEVLDFGVVVAIIPISEHIGTAATSDLIAQRRQVATRLAVPLGNRVVLDHFGAPIMITAVRPQRLQFGFS